MSNRSNKRTLVDYLVLKLKNSHDKLSHGQTLIISSEESAWEVSNMNGSKPLSFLNSNQEEADTRIFFIIFKLSFTSYLIQSTDSDILFVACLLAPQLSERNITIQYNVPTSAPSYVLCRELFTLINDDPDPLIALNVNQGKCAQVYGIIHFVSGCDYLSHLRGFSKSECCKAVLKHLDFILPPNVQVSDLFSIDPEHQMERNTFMVKFICALYRYKYNSCFKHTETLSSLMYNEVQNESLETLIDNVRNNTWHKTIVCQNTIPTYEALCLHAKRLSYVLHKISITDIGIQPVINIAAWAWEFRNFDGLTVPIPIWDTDENKKSRYYTSSYNA